MGVDNMRAPLYYRRWGPISVNILIKGCDSSCSCHSFAARMAEQPGTLLLPENRSIPVLVSLRQAPPDRMKQWGGVFTCPELDVAPGGPYTLQMGSTDWQIWIVRIDRTPDGWLALFRDAGHREL